MGDSQAEFDQENLNEDVARMRGLWINEMVRLHMCSVTCCCVSVVAACVTQNVRLC